ncbi:MAG: YhcH/YjgK/YiaL family protein [Muribaculaceae bacterium]
MIIGSIEHPEAYFGLHPLMKEAFEWLKANYRTAHGNGNGRIAILGNYLYANVETVKMKCRKEQHIEVHRRFIDIHVPVNKEETIGWRCTKSLEKPIGEYNAERDIAFYSDVPDAHCAITPGCFAIATPDDGHAPIIGEGELLKICIKILIDY